MSEHGPTLEQILDGLALWQEHRPQTAEDWIKIAERCLDDPRYEVSESSVLFQALVTAVAALRAVREGA